MFTQAAILALNTAPALREIEIGGRVYAICDLDDARMAELRARGERIMEAGRGGLPLDAADQDAAGSLRCLLLAANPGLDWDVVQRSVTTAHCRAGTREVWRQAIVRHLSPAAAAGRA